MQGALETLWWALADAKRTSRKYLLAPSALVAAGVTWAVLARHLTLFPGLDPVEPGRRHRQAASALAGVALIALYFADEHRAFVEAAAGGPILWHGTLLATLVWPTLWSTCALIEAGSVRARPLSSGRPREVEGAHLLEVDRAEPATEAHREISGEAHKPG